MIGNVSKKGILFASLFIIVLIAAAVFLHLAASPQLAGTITVQSSRQVFAASANTKLTAGQRQSSVNGEDIERAFSQWLAHIKTSSHPKDVIARVIYNKDPSNNIADLKQLLDADPQNPLLHYLLATNCLRVVDASVCKPVKQSALAIFESDNGILGDLEFIEAYKRGDFNAALAALGDASRVNHTSDFYGAEFKALTESMEGAGFKHNMHMIETTTGIMAASVDSLYSGIWTACKQHSQREWQDACYNRGITLAENSVSDWPKAIGLQLIKTTGRIDEPRYEKLNAQSRRQREDENALLPLWEAAHTNNVQLNDEQWNAFLMLCETEGEAAAKRYLLTLLKQH